MADSKSLIAMEDVPQIAPFDPTKKKKKKKQPVIQHTLVEREDIVSMSEEADVFTGLIKKKRPVGINTMNDFNTDAAEELHDSGEDNEEDGLDQPPRCPSEGSERDYRYKELLLRIFSFLHENNPQHAGDRRRTVLRPLQVLLDGSTKTVLVNFIDLCKTMQRQPEHVIAFMLSELGTSGSLDGENRLIVGGRFAPKNFEDLLQRYINEYVLCNCCRSPDTILSKENRIFLLQCELCGSERCVAPIEVGYRTRVEHRKTGT